MYASKNYDSQSSMMMRSGQNILQGIPVTTDYSGQDMTMNNDHYRSSDIQPALPVREVQQMQRPRKKSEKKKYVRGLGRVNQDGDYEGDGGGDNEYEDRL